MKVKTSNYSGWTKFEHEFTSLPNVFIFELRTVYKAAIASDVGVDDLYVAQGSCGSANVPASTTPLPPIDKQNDCNFEPGHVCNWVYQSKSWLVVSSQTG